MPAVSRSIDHVVAKSLERLARVTDVAGACSLVLDCVIVESEFEHAVVVVRSERDFRVVGWGVPDEDLEAFASACRAQESLLSVAFTSREPGLILGPERFPSLKFTSYALLPFHGVHGEPLGAVLIETGRLDERTEFVSEVFVRCGPMIGRCLERELMEARVDKLNRQRDLLTTIVDALPDPVLLTNWENDILLANRRAEQLFSSGQEDSDGRRRAIQINNLLFSSFLTQSIISTRKPGSRELNLVDPLEGSDLLFEVLSVPLPAPPTGGGQVISILRDITDLKRAVTQLESQFGRLRVAEHGARQERDQLNAILENVSDPILVTDEQSNIILLNREADRLFVVPVGGDPETPQTRMIEANDTKFTTLISDFLLQTDNRRVQRLKVSDPDTGGDFPAEVVSCKILNARGEPTAIVSLVHDLTQAAENERLATELQELNDDLEDRIRRATEELEEHNRRLEWQSRELEKASRLKSEFLANMSHELRTPINVVLGYTSLMRERIYGELTDKQDEALEKVYGTSQHLLDLINDILDLSKIEAGKMPLHLEHVRLEDVLGELSETIEPMIRAKIIEYRLRLAENLPSLHTDRTKLKQILLNLLSNAIKFTHRGAVTVHARIERPGRVRLMVEDTGIGLRPEHLETIFEDFRQVDQSHTREYGGTGLGLSITRNLLKVLGGSISVDSTYGEGSRFTIELPTSLDEKSSDDPPAPTHVPAEARVVQR